MSIRLLTQAAMLSVLTGLAGLLAQAALEAQATPDSWRAEGWATDLSKRSVGWNEIISGGLPKDGIPSIDNPKFVSVVSSNDLQPREPVIGLEIAGEAKAYPLRILVWHEIVNDTVGGVPVVVTYCPLCNAAIVFDRRVAGQSLTFGTTGKLRNSDLVMYDRATESWWQQFTGEAIVGEHTGRRLQLVPSRLESFELFSKRHPGGSVLVPNDPGLRDYGSNPYVGYDSSERPFLFNGDLPDGIDPMARVVVVRVGEPRAVSLELLRKRRTMTVDGVVLSWIEGQNSALDHARIGKGRDVGNVIAQRKLKDGAVVDVPYDVTFAFVFHSFHPNTTITK
jgi:hypothetical protein